MAIALMWSPESLVVLLKINLQVVSRRTGIQWSSFGRWAFLEFEWSINRQLNGEFKRRISKTRKALHLASLCQQPERSRYSAPVEHHGPWDSQPKATYMPRKTEEDSRKFGLRN